MNASRLEAFNTKDVDAPGCSSWLWLNCFGHRLGEGQLISHWPGWEQGYRECRVGRKDSGWSRARRPQSEALAALGSRSSFSIYAWCYYSLSFSVALPSLPSLYPAFITALQRSTVARWLKCLDGVKVKVGREGERQEARSEVKTRQPPWTSTPSWAPATLLVRLLQHLETQPPHPRSLLVLGLCWSAILSGPTRALAKVMFRLHCHDPFYRRRASQLTFGVPRSNPLILLH